jgi:hypothetical protein
VNNGFEIIYKEADASRHLPGVTKEYCCEDSHCTDFAKILIQALLDMKE